MKNTLIGWLICAPLVGLTYLLFFLEPVSSDMLTDHWREVLAFFFVYVLVALFMVMEPRI